jgi:hypothetical protein
VAELEALTGLPLQWYLDAMTLPPDDMRQAMADAKALGKMSWATIPDRAERVMAILNVVGTVVGVGAAVIGFGQALRSL